MTQSICAAKAMRHAWIRVFSTYGPRDNAHWVIPSVINTLRNGQVPKLTSAEQRWDYLYVDDAARAVAMIIEDDTAEGVFNLGSGQALPLRNVIVAIRDLVAPGAKLGFGEVPYRSDQVMFLEADISRLTRLGWKPDVDIQTGLRKTAAWFQAGIA